MSAAPASVLPPSLAGMIRRLAPDSPAAYPVPWRIDRSDARHPIVTNASREPVDFVRLFRSDGLAGHWGRVRPGEDVTMCLCEADLDALAVTIAWYRSRTDEEYCWRFVL